MKHVTSRVLFAYWNALRGERASPERSAIGPGAIRHILADVFILEVGVLGGAAFRIAGTRLCALFGHELKGQRFERLWPPHAGEDARRSVGIVLDEAAGLVSGHRGVTPEGAAVNLEMLLLPLRDRGRTHTAVLGALSPAISPLWLGLSPIALSGAVSQRIIRTGWCADRPDPAVEPTRRFVVHRGGRA
jgi:hypothetical protein